VVVPRNVARALKRFPLDERKALFQAIAALAEESRPPGAARLRVKDLGEYRIRVRGFYIRYDMDDGARTVSILAVKPRGQAYRI
jgi:mRNA-degrading endonuclease RelE of RelBE toxin-antitoxin system